ncbi:MAG: ABC transporter ATP-binding protein [Spirochaetales bacterium]|nr:ABC transporter ATP-binding protein [Spirochaetales bacterium]
MKTAIEINNLSKSFKDFNLNNISLKLEEGFIMGLVGQNGAGKTTLIKLLLGLLKPDYGEITLLERNFFKDELALKQEIGFIIDDAQWYDSFNLSEIIKIISPFYQKWDNNIFDKYMKDFNLNNNQKYGELSRGMKMKFNLAIALSHKARLIIMDEPTSGLDPVIRAELLEILQKLIAEENRSVLFSSHISTDIEKIADYITFINDGEILFSESKEDLFEKYILVKGNKNLLDSGIIKDFNASMMHEHSFTALSSDSELIKRKFSNYFDDGSLIQEKLSIDDIMLLYIKGNTKKDSSQLKSNVQGGTNA